MAAATLMRASLLRTGFGRKLCCPSTTVFYGSLPGRREYSDYYNSKPEGLPEEYTKPVLVKDPEAWKYVERLLPFKTVPEPPKNNEVFPSGWRPPSDAGLKLTYRVRRTKNHMLPVYLDVSHRGMRRITKVRGIEGNIWDLAKELQAYLQSKEEILVAHRVHEVYCTVYFKGDHVRNVESWLYSKGL